MNQTRRIIELTLLLGICVTGLLFAFTLGIDFGKTMVTTPYSSVGTDSFPLSTYAEESILPEKEQLPHRIKLAHPDLGKIKMAGETLSKELHQEIIETQLHLKKEYPLELPSKTMAEKTDRIRIEKRIKKKLHTQKK